MDFLYVLYSKTRKVLYVHEHDHSRFWSKYIRNKYPKDQWYVGKDIDVDYIELMRQVRECKRVNLAYPSDLSSNKLHREIYDAMESGAILQLESTTFIVSYANRGDVIMEYNGPELKKAIHALSNSRGADSIEVWRHGRFVDTILGEIDYRSKFAPTA